MSYAPVGSGLHAPVNDDNTWVDVDVARLTLMQTQFAKASGHIERQLLAVELLANCGLL